MKHNLNLHLRKTHKVNVVNNTKKLTKVMPASNATKDGGTSQLSITQTTDTQNRSQMAAKDDNTAIANAYHTSLNSVLQLVHPSISAGQVDLANICVLEPGPNVHLKEELHKPERKSDDMSTVDERICSIQPAESLQEFSRQYEAVPIKAHSVLSKQMLVAENRSGQPFAMNSAYLENYFQVQDAGTTSLLTELIKDSLSHVQQ